MEDANTGRITTTYPTLDCVVLNAGLQRTLDFTQPAAIDLARVDTELRTNYQTPVHMIIHFLPHLISLNPRPAGVVLVTSGLSVIPLPRCANYCATKAALHSLAWSLRAQLAGPASSATHHVRVIELVPPAVQTELHTQQQDLVALGQDKIGLPLEDYIAETWADLVADDDRDEIVHSVHRDRLAASEELRRRAFEGYVDVMRKQGIKF